MSSSSKLDQIVKGAAPPGTSPGSIISPSSPARAHHNNPSSATGLAVPATTPSTPPQIYLNLLILEASLRSQYLTLRARRRQNTFFLLLLTLWNTFFFYLLFLNPREDGRGIGGSVYWVVEMMEKVALMGGVLTGILIWGTGQYERGVRWPRKFVGAANRGLRVMNCKIIILRGPWWREQLSHLAFLFPYSSFFPTQGSSYHYIDASAEKKGHQLGKHGHDEDADYIREEDLAPGGDHVKLLLLPKPFSHDFREDWELYRSEYWERENERRALLLQRLKAQEKRRARELGGWLWWTGWRGWRTRKRVDVEKYPSHPRNVYEKDVKRLAHRSSNTHSRSSSRPSTPSTLDGEERPPSRGSRRGSNAGDSRRRSKLGSQLGMQPINKLTAANLRGGPGEAVRLARASSSFGTSGTESDAMGDLNSFTNAEA